MRILSYFLGMTVNEWVDKYLSIVDTSDLSIHTKDHRHTYVRRFARYFGKRRLKSLKRLEIRDAYLKEREIAPHRGRAFLLCARLCLNEAMLDGLIQNNPARNIKMTRPMVVRRRLSIDTFWRVYHAAPENHYFRLALKLALATGQRRSDLVKMRYTDIIGGYLRVIQQKTGARVEIPLTLTNPILGESLGDIIEQCKRHNSRGFEWFLQNERGGKVSATSLTTWFYDCRRTNKKGDPSFHELRSLSERSYRDIGVDTQTLLGHSSKIQTDEYNDERDPTAYRRVKTVA